MTFGCKAMQYPYPNCATNNVTSCPPQSMVLLVLYMYDTAALSKKRWLVSHATRLFVFGRHTRAREENVIPRCHVAVITLTRLIKSLVTGQAPPPVPLERRKDAPGKSEANQKWYTR